VASPVTPDELPRDLPSFLDWRERQDGTFEFLGLTPRPLLPRERQASLIEGNLLAALDEALDGKSGLGLEESVTLCTADAFAIASLVVGQRTACLASPPCYLANDELLPLVIVEIASPETALRVHVERWEACRHIPSLRHYLVVEQDQRLVRLQTRQRETAFAERCIEAGPVPLEAIGITLDVDSIYAGVIDG
jgi:hypothetical protein